MYANEKVGYEQAGFRPEFSTIDHIFSLYAIIEYYKSKNSRVCCAFVDYRKTFDLVKRSSLWIKMLKEGVNGKILAIIRNLYMKAISWVRCNNDLSSFFSCNIGVRQGENISPILFAIYLNDFQESLSKNYQGLHTLAGDFQNELELFMKLYILLDADDTLIMAESSDDLQAALNGLYDYCKAWSLSMNISKTKVVIFSKVKVRRFPKLYLGEEEVDMAYDYVYLGVTFNYNGTFTKAMEKQINQARKAMFFCIRRSANFEFTFWCDLWTLWKMCYSCFIVWLISMGFQQSKGCRNFPPQILEIGLKNI